MERRNVLIDMSGGDIKAFTWRTIPERHDLMRIRVTRHTLCTGQSKISKLQFTNFTYQQVLWLHVAMKDAAFMAIGETAKQLEEEQSNVSMIEATGMSLHILREVRVLK